ncbi:MAG TPA: NlpC/P60 family protein [Fimbriimonadaceae bacterium]|nr:NlpC/P60 family protein [Fimbriimonadaceae bacterium]
MKRFLLCILAILPATHGTSVQNDLAGVTVRYIVDPLGDAEQTAPVSVRAQRDGDSYAVPVKDFLFSILHIDADNRHLLRVEPSNGAKTMENGEFLNVFREGKLWVSMPVLSRMKEGKERDALVYEPPGSKDPSVRVNLKYLPILKNAKYYMNIDQLAPLFGASTDYTQKGLVVKSARYWAEALLGHDRVPVQYWPQLSFIPRFGVSPVVNNELRAWVRTRRSSYLQMYSTLEGYLPLIGRDGKDLVNESEGIEEAAHLKGGEVFVHHTAYSSSEGTATVIAVLSEKRLDPDPRKHILADKSLKYSIIGLSQDLGKGGLEYRWVEAKTGEKSNQMAARLEIEQSIFEVLNGVDAGEPLKAGMRYLTFAPPTQPITKSGRTDIVVNGLYCIRRTDTLDSLSKLWEVSAVDILEFAGIDEEEFVTGALIPQIAPIAKAARGSAMQGQAWIGTVTRGTRALAGLNVTEPYVNLDKGQLVRVVGAMVDDGQQYYVTEMDKAHKGHGVSNGPWFIRASYVVRGSTQNSGGLSNGQKIVREALRYLGTPYVWGGNSLEKGIDCSHFVKQVYAAVKEPCPSAPVINQEDYGDIVHIDPSRKFFVYKNKGVTRDRLPMPIDRELTNWSNLRLGDRLIYQWRNDESSGSRHTAIFSGSLDNKPRTMVHAIGRGVSVTSVWYKGYAYTVRGNRKR